MSSPIRPAKDLDALLMYAPSWAREKLPVVSVAADERPIEQPPQSHGVDAMGPTFSEDLAPSWAREKLPVVPVAADERPIEQPPQSHGVDAMGPTFSEDLAPSWAREKLPVVPVAADERPIEQPPQSHGVDAMGPTFSEDLAPSWAREKLPVVPVAADERPIEQPPQSHGVDAMASTSAKILPRPGRVRAAGGACRGGRAPDRTAATEPWRRRHESDIQRRSCGPGFATSALAQSWRCSSSDPEAIHKWCVGSGYGSSLTRRLTNCAAPPGSMHTGVLPWPKGADWDRAPKRKARQTRGASRLAQVQTSQSNTRRRSRFSVTVALRRIGRATSLLDRHHDGSSSWPRSRPSERS